MFAKYFESYTIILRGGGVFSWTRCMFKYTRKKTSISGFQTKTSHAKSSVGSASCPVRHLSSPRVGNPRLYSEYANSRTGQLADAIGSSSFDCNYTDHLWTSNTARVTACDRSNKHVRVQALYTAGGIRQLTIVRQLAYPRVVQWPLI